MNAKHKHRRYAWIVLLILLFFNTPATGDPSPQGPATDPALLETIELLRQKGVISADEAEAIKKRGALNSSAGPEGAPSVDAHGTPVDKAQDKKIDTLQTETRLNQRADEKLEKERIDPLHDFARDAEWARRISLGGDLRLRYQADYFDEDNGAFLNPSDPDEVMNTTEDRDRIRARVRLELKAKLVDPRSVNVGKVDLGVRVATGNEDDPVSTNETLGDYFNKDSVVFDRYYLRYSFKPDMPIWGRVPQFSLTGGRMPNPWFSSDLVWDDDLNFEGAALGLQTDTLAENGWHLFLTGGAFPLQEVELSTDDKWLYAGQLGLGAEPFYGFAFKLAGAYYFFSNISGQVNDPTAPGENDFSAPIFQQKGNTLIDIDPSDDMLTALAAEYQVVDLTGEIDFSFFHPVHVILEGTYIKNIGFDQDEVSQRTGIDGVPVEDEGYRAGIRLGYPTIAQYGEWNTSFHYRYLEADAMVDAFTDSDFHMGGTNAKGWIAALELGLYKNVWLRTRWLTSDEIEGPPLAVDTLQVDLNARF
jgi:hypothetical protein